MQLRYLFENNENGVLIYESDPQMRLMYVSPPMEYWCFDSLEPKRKRLALPYLRFVIRYEKHKDGVIYPGITGHGLHVFCGNSPLISLREKSQCFYTDPCGIVCTDHYYDRFRFRSREELVNKVISLWYGHNHQLYDTKSYKMTDMTMEQVLSKIWGTGGTYQGILNNIFAGTLPKIPLFPRE